MPEDEFNSGNVEVDGGNGRFSGGGRRPRGLKPGINVVAGRGAEAPLFHGGACGCAAVARAVVRAGIGAAQRGGGRRPRGLKPGINVVAGRGAEAPLFHGGACGCAVASAVVRRLRVRVCVGSFVRESGGSKRRGGRPRGLKPGINVVAGRGAEAPLFHGCACGCAGVARGVCTS